MINLKPDRPYLDAWLRRTSRQFAVSGRLSQTALLLARDEGGTHAEWCERLRAFLNSEETPSLDLLTKIDALLASPGRAPRGDASQGLLF